MPMYSFNTIGWYWVRIPTVSIPELMQFADCLEKTSVKTIESGRMTKDLALITELTDVKVLNSAAFIQEIRKELEALMA